MVKANPARKTRTLVVDDSPVVAKLLCSFLETLENVEVVGTAASGQEALEAAEALLPDLVLMDFDMPGMNGLEATAQLRIRFPETRIVIVTMHDLLELRSACQLAGATGFVSKTELARQLPALIRQIFPDPEDPA